MEDSSCLDNYRGQLLAQSIKLEDLTAAIEEASLTDFLLDVLRERGAVTNDNKFLFLQQLKEICGAEFSVGQIPTEEYRNLPANDPVVSMYEEIIRKISEAFLMTKENDATFLNALSNEAKKLYGEEDSVSILVSRVSGYIHEKILKVW